MPEFDDVAFLIDNRVARVEPKCGVQLGHDSWSGPLT